MMIMILGFDCDWKLLHMLNSGGNGDRAGGDVPNPATEVQRWDQQPVGAPHRRDPHRHAHRLVRDDGHRVPPPLAAGSHHQAHDRD